jgi:hypothetical protein
MDEINKLLDEMKHYAHPLSERGKLIAALRRALEFMRNTDALAAKACERDIAAILKGEP